MSSVLRTPSETAERFNVPVDTLKRWRYMKIGPRFVRLGRHVRYRDEDIESFIRENLEGGHTEVRRTA